MAPLREVIKQLLNEVKIALEEYFQETEDALKQRVKKLLIFSIATTIMISVSISLIGAASLFFLIGSLVYLYTILPAWQAWFVIGATAAVVAAALLISAALIIYRQFRSSKNKPAEAQKQLQCEPTKNSS
ncbi:MAG: hypothetical protein ACQCN3_04230 [Candidatus Bathyarchaeia archaeon]